MNLRTEDVKRRFDRVAGSFDNFDFVHAATRDGLLARLEPIRVDAKTVLDLGCATGSACMPLARRFRGARLIAIDLSAAMLQAVRQKQSWRRRFSLLQADARAIPLPNHSIDVVFSNQLLPWIDDPGAVFSEVNRVLRDNGLFLFASLGPDSFSELREAWLGVDAGSHVSTFPDMHELGDDAVRAGLRDPVLDVDRLTVSYRDPDALYRDLAGSGARNCLASRAGHLTGKNRFAAMTTALWQQRGAEAIGLDLELVYGHCWGSGQVREAGEFRIDPARIGRRT